MKTSSIIGTVILAALIATGAYFLGKNAVEKNDASEPANTKTATSSSKTTESKKRASQPSLKRTRTPAGVTVVTYTASGFRPSVVLVDAGETVRFTNASGKALRIAPQDDPVFADLTYHGFDQAKSIGKGASFDFTFSDTGVWAYKNLNEPTHLGVVIVD